MNTIFLILFGVVFLLLFMLFISQRFISSNVFHNANEIAGLRNLVKSSLPEEMAVPIVLTEGAFMPKRKHGDEDACYDIICPQDIPLTFGRSIIPTGIKFSVPFGFVAVICPTSGNTVKGLAVQSKKGDSLITDYRINGDAQLGIIDPGYTGEIGVMFNNHLHPKKTEGEFTIKRGTKIGQILFLKTEKVKFIPVKSLEETKRADKGYGSTDNDCF